jgi:competence protein ComEC
LYWIPPALALVYGAVCGWQNLNSAPELIFVNVGQGDCTLFRVGTQVLVDDVGPRTPTFDAGATIVVPKLRELGWRPTLILLTHPDRDHVGGLAAVHAAYPEAPVAISKEFRDDPHMLDQLREADIAPSAVHWMPLHSSAQMGDFTLRIVCPPWHAGEDDNDACAVVRLSHGPASAVLMGDAGFAEEGRLIPEGGWQSQILKVGHHGSRYSSSPEWLAAVKPVFGIISCGRNNPYGHPHRETLERLEAANITPLRTDQLNTIAFREGAKGFQAE